MILMARRGSGHDPGWTSTPVAAQKGAILKGASIMVLRGLRNAALAACLVLTVPALAQTPPAGLPAVVVSPVALQALSDSADFLGRIQAAEKVELRARVEGFITEQRFKEGQMVKKGDVLFVIDKAPYEATLDQRKADLAAAQAIEANAVVQLQRTKELAERGNAPQATLDQRIAEEAKAKADIAKAQAALRTAEINLSYTEIVAPIAGRIGTASVTPGNLVNPATGPLATIVSIDPINVTFPVTQRELLQARQRAGGEPQRIVVGLRLADGSTYDQSGRVELLDVAANQGTDSVTVRATIPNPKGTLIDGSSVRVLLAIGEPEKRLVIPTASVAIDQQGPFVLVVGDGNKVQIRRLQLGAQRGGLTVIEKGLAEGERVIVEGMVRVRPGMQVAPTVAPPSPARS
ncbi:MAG: efflux RND transporter periplasmic adaptor subunit [Burkholderiales bacterium]|nr:efflux RND transporter periplasmic adaptor subunit [Burkholderiales bacterium]